MESLLNSCGLLWISLWSRFLFLTLQRSREFFLNYGVKFQRIFFSNRKNESQKRKIFYAGFANRKIFTLLSFDFNFLISLISFEHYEKFTFLQRYLDEKNVWKKIHLESHLKLRVISSSVKNEMFGKIVSPSHFFLRKFQKNITIEIFANFFPLSWFEICPGKNWK